MTTDEQQQGQAAGSVAHAYRNKLFWHWAPAMPKGIPASFVTVLYALSSAADPSGKVRFRDGKAIRIKDIAAASKCDEKDARRYIQAAIVAGVLTVQGEQRRGRSSLYVLVLLPSPDWGAAVSSLMSTRRKSRKAPPWLDEENGGVTPELSEGENGVHAPELPDSDETGERGTRPRMGSGDTPPFGSGDTPPNNPGFIHESSHDGAEVVSQPQVDGPTAAEPIIENHEQHTPTNQPTAVVLGFLRCAICHERLIPDPLRPERDSHTHCAKRAAQHGQQTAQAAAFQTNPPF